MKAIKNLVKRVQKGEAEAHEELLKAFKPLIIAWLRQSKELYQKNREDYESMAKIILLESVQTYDEARGVPFQSYYKINLYHWYANHKRKKYWQEVALTEATSQTEQETDDLEEVKEQMEEAIKTLPPTQQHIVKRLKEGYSEQEIALELGLKKKTVQNKKYEALDHLRKYIKEIGN